MADPDKPLDLRVYNPDGTPKSFKGQPPGGPRPGAGRPKGSLNGPQTRFKELARKYTDPAIRELVRIAGFAQKTDKDGNLLFKVVNGEEVPDMIPGSPSDTARIAAINILLERGWGKATQKIAGDETESPIAMRNENIEIRRVVVGTGNPDAANGVGAPSNEAESAEDESGEKRA